MPLPALDPGTLLFSLSLLGFLTAGLSISLARPAGDARHALVDWGRAMLCVGVAFQLILFHEQLPPFVPFVVANALVMALPLFALLAYQRLAGRRPWTRAAATVFTIQATALVALHAIDAPRATVIVAVCSALAGEFGLVAAIAMHERGRNPAPFRWIAGSTMIVVALVFAARVASVLAGAEPAVAPASGNSVHVASLIAAALAIVGSTLAFVLTVHDRQHREALDRAHRDSVTGLHTRRSLFDELARLDARGASHALVMIDIDHFKAINDSRGHAAGDAVLAHFARLLRRAVRETDVAVRYGGDEFCVLLRGCSAPDAASFAGRLVAEAAARPVRLPGGVEARITVSAGCVIHSPGHGAGDPATGALRMLGQADDALYDAKRAGRNCAIVRAVSPLRAEADRAAGQGTAAGS